MSKEINLDRWVSGNVTELHQWTDTLFSLRVKAEIQPFIPGQFTKIGLEIDGELVSRPYSFVNPPQDELLEVHFNEVPDGPLSPRLAALEPGDRVWVSHAPNGFFTIEELPASESLWMIATGTALGVYLSILRTEKAWKKFRHIVLVHNVRHRNHLSYGEEIAALKKTYGEQFTAAVEAFQARDFEKAQRLFDECGRLRPDDFAAREYATLAATFQKEPPGGEWMGAIELREK